MGQSTIQPTRTDRAPCTRTNFDSMPKNPFLSPDPYIKRKRQGKRTPVGQSLRSDRLRKHQSGPPDPPGMYRSPDQSRRPCIQPSKGGPSPAPPGIARTWPSSSRRPGFRRPRQAAALPRPGPRGRRAEGSGVGPAVAAERGGEGHYEDEATTHRRAPLPCTKPTITSRFTSESRRSQRHDAEREPRRFGEGVPRLLPSANHGESPREHPTAAECEPQRFAEASGRRFD